VSPKRVGFTSVTGLRSLNKWTGWRAEPLACVYVGRSGVLSSSGWGGCRAWRRRASCRWASSKRPRSYPYNWQEGQSIAFPDTEQQRGALEDGPDGRRQRGELTVVSSGIRRGEVRRVPSRVLQRRSGPCTSTWRHRHSTSRSWRA